LILEIIENKFDYLDLFLAVAVANISDFFLIKFEISGLYYYEIGALMVRLF